MAYDFTTLQADLFARGFDYLNDGGIGLARVKRWINVAMQEVDSAALWPYLLGSTTSAAPVTISDLRRVESIQDTGSGYMNLAYRDRRLLVEDYGDLTQTGNPEWFYFSSQTQVSVFPANTTNSLLVRYYKFAPDLVNTSDTPLMPDRFRPIIVELAVAKAYREDGDVQDEQDAMQEYQRLLQVMVRELLNPQVQTPQYVRQTWPINY